MAERYEGRFITAKQKKNRERLVKVGRKFKKSKIEEKEVQKAEKIANEEETKFCVVEGRRIVDFEVMCQHLQCVSCNEDLSLRHIERENRQGLASVLTIRCFKCLFLNNVPTSKQHFDVNTKKLLFDINANAALSTLHSGLGYASTQRYLETMNIPSMSWKTYKKYERVAGQAIEHVVKESCSKATAIERSLTLQNHAQIEKLLPEDLRVGFIVQSPSASSGINQSQEFPMEAKSFEEESSMTALAESGTEVPWTSAITASPDKMPIHNVRLMASYDMGWSTRGNGYQYDSLNGYGALIGTQSNLVLDYETRNRKCRMCDLGHPVEDHDCRLNFFGSAKAMEPEVAASLATGSQILKAHHVSVGVLIGDNDSSSICAVRKKSSHEVIKHSDFNHTSKGVKNMLYKIGKDKDPDGELSPDAIKYLHRCFTYAVAQNKGNTDAVKSAILNIPFHAFNIHRKCGTWCKYVRDPEKYSHSDITNFKNDILFEELKRVFTKLSDNADKFSAGASSQANESLNSIMSRKAPKNICYSRSESADIRYACAVGQKNEGEQYIQNAMTKVLEMSPGTRCSKFVERSDRVKKYRTMRAKTPAAKWKRRCLRNQRSQLRHNKQQTEGRTYERHMGLLEIPAVDGDSLSNYMIENDENLFVFFDLETAGLKDTCDILQIACKSGNIEFNKYMKPRHAIPSRASEIHGITSAEGELYHNGQQVFSQSASNVLEELCIYLNNFKKPCIFVAHNCSFDAPRLMRIIVNCSVIEKFKPLIAGFCDTLPLFRKKFPERKSKGQNSLTTLATETLSNISIENAHDASYDTFLLQELVRCHFSVDELAKDCKSFDDILQLLLNKPKIANTMQTLAPLDTIISCAMRKRLAIAGVNYSLIVSTFHRNEKEAIELLEQREDGKPQLIKTKKMLLKILDFLKKQS